MKRTVPEITRSKYAIPAIDVTFSRPIFRPIDFIECSEIPTKRNQGVHKQLQNQ